jgi:hypothetical protein
MKLLEDVTHCIECRIILRSLYVILFLSNTETGTKIVNCRERDHLQKLIVAELIKILPSLCGIGKCINLFGAVHHWAQS